MQTLIPTSGNLQADFFRSLNQFVEPLIRAGFGSLVCSPTALIVLETKGRKTGHQLRVPLLATRVGRFVLVSTFRKQSNWIKNLQANPQVRYWLGGLAQEARAVVLSAAATPDDLENLPPVIKNFANAQKHYFALFGGHVAILMPREGARVKRS